MIDRIFNYAGLLLQQIPKGSAWLRKTWLFHRARPYLKFVLSPTRWLIDRLKTINRFRRGERLRGWSLLLFVLEFTLSVSMAVTVEGHPSRTMPWWGWLFMWWAFARINEITYAFYNDAMRKLSTRMPLSNLTVPERIRMAMRSLFGLAFNFAVLYYFLPWHDVDVDKQTGLDNLSSFVDALYFSGVTLATLGYGDLAPVGPRYRLLAIYEVFSGILIIAVAIATYVGGDTGMKRKLPKT